MFMSILIMFGLASPAPTLNPHQIQRLAQETTFAVKNGTFVNQLEHMVAANQTIVMKTK